MAAPPVPPPPPPPVPPRPYELFQQPQSSTSTSYTSYGTNNAYNSNNEPSTSGSGTRPPPIPPLPPDLIRAQQQQQQQQERYEPNMIPPLDFAAGGGGAGFGGYVQGGGGTGVGYGDSQPHFENPLIAPRPHRVDPSIPLNMARTLDDQVSQTPINYTPGFVVPPPSQAQQQQTPSINWTHYASTSGAAAPIGSSSDPNPYFNQVVSSFSSLSMAPPPPPPPAPSISSSTTNTTDLPPLTAPIPLLSQLAEAAPKIQSPTHDPALKISWCRDVLFLLERAQGSLTATDPPVGPVNLPSSPENTILDGLAKIAVQLILQLAGTPWKSKDQQGKKQQTPAYVAEALYHRATFAATGAFPAYVPHNPRTAFRDYEAAARGGYGAAWFRLGRDYENFKDDAHAKECFERGVKAGVGSCLYRMGMAHLLGQLTLPSSPSSALPLLARSAHLASLRAPQPAYVYALLLLSEFTSIAPLPPPLFSSLRLIPPGSSPSLEARKHLERAAYLGFGAAQYKLGHAYEFAEPPWPFDPVMSVRWYSAASESGESEADMALSKWFLCGSGGAALSSSSSSSTSALAEGGASDQGGFEKDESLALLFAEKAARKGLASAEFAMGYYAEVGVGQTRDLGKARGWYELAKAHGNTDASARLAALSAPSPSTLTRAEHDTLTETKLVRRRTLAAQRAETEPLSPPWEGRTFPSARVWEEGDGGLGLGQGQGESRQQGVRPAPGQGQGQGQGQGERRRQDGRMVVDVMRKNSMASRPAGYATQQQSVPGGVSGGIMQSSVPVGARMGGREQSPQRRAQSRERERYLQQQQGYQNYPQTPTQHQQQQMQMHAAQRNGRTTPPAPQGGRAPSPGRYLGGAAVAGGGGARPIGSGRSDSPGRGRGQLRNTNPEDAANVAGLGAGRTKLERMRLNLDDPPPPSSSSSSSSLSSSVPGSVPNPNGNGYTLTDGVYTPSLATATPGVASLSTPKPMGTPRPGRDRVGQGQVQGQGQGGGAGGGGGVTPTPAAGGAGGGKYPQTFAEMGFHGAKAEEKDCVIM